MLDWLLSSIDPVRIHNVGLEASWHARLMVIAWMFFIPAGVFAARFFKITTKQDWPKELDNRTWWMAHLIFQYSAGVLILIALVLIWQVSGSYDDSFWHHLLGWMTVVLCGMQFLAGWFRGTRGGPSELEKTGSVRGDHFDMTLRRRIFERVHKSVGYVSISLSIMAVFSGLWMTNAPRWMWIAVALWWPIMITYFVRLQKSGRVADTYEAIWGPDPELPGNKMKPIGVGVKKRKL